METFRFSTFFKNQNTQKESTHIQPTPETTTLENGMPIRCFSVLLAIILFVNSTAMVTNTECGKCIEMLRSWRRICDIDQKDEDCIQRQLKKMCSESASQQTAVFQHVCNEYKGLETKDRLDRTYSSSRSDISSILTLPPIF